MKAILCSMVPHYSHTAVALQEAGFLKRYVTGLFWTKRKRESIGKLLPADLQKKLLGSGRYNEDLKPSLVTSLWYVEAIRKGLEQMPFISSYYKTLISNTLFDLLSFLYLGKCDILHIVSSQGSVALRKAKKEGAIVIVDERIAHVTYLVNLLKEEYANFGLSLNVKGFLEARRRREYELADFIFVPSQFVYDSFVKMGIERRKLFIVPYGVDLETFQPTTKMDDTFRLIFVGQIGFRKGVYYLLEACRQLHLKNLELVLVGNIEEPFKPILEKYIGVFKHVPHIPQKQLYALYGNSSVFVFPSLAEGSALVTYEAMACGLPVIVTENSGAVARDGKDGFVVPIRDIEALKEKISILYENEDLRKQMGDSGKEYVKEFTWKRYGERIQEVYKRIAELCKISMGTI